MASCEIVGAATDRGPMVGTVESDGSFVILAGLDDFWADAPAAIAAAVSGDHHGGDRITDYRRMPPIPSSAQVFCIGLNYADHVAEGSFAASGIPDYPTIFARWPASLTVDGAEIPIPLGEQGLDWEGEIVAWVGRPLIDASPEEADAAVVGYSVFNDVTARHAQKLTSQWTVGKSGDRSGPLGPLVPAALVGDLRDGITLETTVNGTTVQRASTEQMIHTVGRTLAHISRTITIRPGDVLATGTPSGVGYSRTPPWLLQPGDVVTVTADRLGSITNTIVGHERREALMRQR